MAAPQFFSGAQNFSIGNMQVNNTARDYYNYSNTNVRNVYRQGDKNYYNYENVGNTYSNTHNGDIYNDATINTGTVNHGVINHVDRAENAIFGNNYGNINQYRSGPPPEPGASGYRPNPPPGGPQFRPGNASPPPPPRPTSAGPMPFQNQRNTPYNPKNPFNTTGPGNDFGSNLKPPGPGAFTASSPEVPYFQDPEMDAQQQDSGPPPAAPTLHHTQTAPGRPQPHEAWAQQSHPAPPAPFPPARESSPHRTPAYKEGMNAYRAAAKRNGWGTESDSEDIEMDVDDGYGVGSGRAAKEKMARNERKGRSFDNDALLSTTDLGASAAAPSSSAKGSSTSTTPNITVQAPTAAPPPQASPPTARPTSAPLTTDQLKASYIPTHRPISSLSGAQVAASVSALNNDGGRRSPIHIDSDSEDDENGSHTKEHIDILHSSTTSQDGKKKKKKRDFFKRMVGGKK